jgi:MoxR-like ATPase
MRGDGVLNWGCWLWATGLENDLYVRQIDGYLPTAEVAFIDEIFKANSAILNALLTLLNERLFDNGNQRNAVPLLCLVCLLPYLSIRKSVRLSITIANLSSIKRDVRGRQS